MLPPHTGKTSTYIHLEVEYIQYIHTWGEGFTSRGGGLDADEVRLKSPRFADFDSNFVSLGEREVYLLGSNFVTLGGREVGWLSLW